MLFILRLIIIACLPVAVFAESAPESASEVSTLEPGVTIEGDSESADNSEVKIDSEAAEASEQLKTTPSANSIERFVMPVTGWMENKIHKSSVLNPLRQKTKEKSASANKTSLRQAILLARESYPGTVLSARKITENNQALHYKIKILSKDGAIREIDVPFYSVQDEDQP